MYRLFKVKKINDEILKNKYALLQNQKKNLKYAVMYKI